MFSFHVIVSINFIQPCFSMESFRGDRKIKWTALILQFLFISFFYYIMFNIGYRTQNLMFTNQALYCWVICAVTKTKQNKTKTRPKNKAKLSVTKFQQCRLHQVQTWCHQNNSEDKIQELCNIGDKNQKILKSKIWKPAIPQTFPYTLKFLQSKFNIVTFIFKSI